MEPLDEPFVDHQLDAFERATKQKSGRDEALKSFDELHKSPYFFRALIELLTLRVDLAIGECLVLLREQMAEKLGYTELLTLHFFPLCFLH